MNFDIRVPIGMLFGSLGLVLIVYGLATHGSAFYERSLGIDVNLIWGCVMVVFSILISLPFIINKFRKR